MFPRRLMNAQVLRQENFEHAGTGGVSAGSMGLGFHPAFYDIAKCSIHLSRFADGRLAPFHLLDGLPDEVVLERSFLGRIVAAKATLVSGFERNGFFYTRRSAARAAADWVARA